LRERVELLEVVSEYQTAIGVESDLRRCLAEWEAYHRINEFPLGQHDIPDRLLIPEKLYGREREVETLLAVFDRVVNRGSPELVLRLFRHWQVIGRQRTAQGACAATRALRLRKV
jgi:hypothetical protein